MYNYIDFYLKLVLDEQFSICNRNMIAMHYDNKLVEKQQLNQRDNPIYKIVYIYRVLVQGIYVCNWGVRKGIFGIWQENFNFDQLYS